MKKKIPLRSARIIYFTIAEMLQPVLHRCEEAGSIRRRCEVVGDVEIIAVPILERDLFGEPTKRDLVLEQLKEFNIVPIKNGLKYKQFIYDGIQIDLWLQPDPETWGVNYMIRTGSADFVKRMMTPRTFPNGWKPPWITIRDARIWIDGKKIETPTERDVFKLWEIDYLLPEKRIK